MDRRFRGPSADKSVAQNSKLKIDAKELKKIKVEIKRKIPGPSSQTQELDHSVDRLEEMKIYRCHGEGSRPLFERDGIVVNKEEIESRTVSTHSPRRSPNGRRSNSSPPHRDDFSRRSNDRSRLKDASPHCSRYSSSHSPRRHSRDTPNRSRDSPRQSSSSYSRTNHRSRSRDSSRRSRRTRSRTRSPRREFSSRRRNTRSPEERDRRRYERKEYGRSERPRKHRRSPSPRYSRSSSRRESRSRPPHLSPIDPAAIGGIPVILPPNIGYYGPDEALWFQPLLRPPMMVPRGLIPPRNMYRAPMYDMRPPMPPRPPYLPMQRPPQFPPIRGPLNRPR